MSSDFTRIDRYAMEKKKVAGSKNLVMSSHSNILGLAKKYVFFFFERVFFFFFF